MIQKTLLTLFTFIVCGYAQVYDTLSLLDIGNEIQLLEKQYKNIPKLFKQQVLVEFENKLDTRLNVNPSTDSNRLMVNHAPYHWCMSKLYLLSGNTEKLSNHYSRYLELVDSQKNIPQIFKQPIPNVKIDSTLDVVEEDLVAEEEKVSDKLEEKVDVSHINEPEKDEESSPASIEAKSSVNNTSDISVISDFESLGIFSFKDLMEYISGIHVVYRGTSPSQSTLSSLGHGSNQIVFLVNGMRSYQSTVYFDDINFPFDLNDVESVDVDYMPSSSRYGFSASGMVINFNLKSYDSFVANTQFYMGDYSNQKLYFDMNLPVKQSNHTISYSSNSNGGYVYNAHHESTKMLYRYSLNDENSTANLSFCSHTEEQGYLTQLNSNYPTESYNNLFFDSRLTWSFGAMELNSLTHWNESENSFSYGENIQEYTVTDLGYDIEGSKQYKNGSGEFGFSAAREMVTNLSNNEFQRDRLSFFYNRTKSKENSNTSKGISANYSEDFGWNFAYGFGYGYNLSDKVNLNYDFDSGYSLPTPFQQHANFGLWNGNKDLEKSTTSSSQFTFSMVNDDLKLTSKVFHSKSLKVIDWTLNSETQLWNSVNIDEVVMNGHQLSTEINLYNWPLISFIKSISFDYTFLDLNHSEGSFRHTSNYLVHDFVTSFNYGLFFGLSQSWNIKYESPQLFDSRWIIDTSFSIPVWKFDTVLSIDNMMGVEYEYESGLSAPGRWVNFGLQFQY